MTAAQRIALASGVACREMVILYKQTSSWRSSLHRHGTAIAHYPSLGVGRESSTTSQGVGGEGDAESLIRMLHYSDDFRRSSLL
jgi:hypothetical protein